MHAAGEAELCALLMVAQKVTPILYRVQAYELIYFAKHIGENALETLRSLSVQIYSTCFELLAHTSRELESKLRRARHALLEPGKATEMIETLKSLEFDHDRAVNLCHKLFTTISHERLEDALRKLKESSEMELNRIGAGVDRLVASDKQNDLEWISPVQYMDDHKLVRKSKAKNTCAWLVEHDAFKKWERAESSALFWLRGGGRLLRTTPFHLASYNLLTWSSWDRQIRPQLKRDRSSSRILQAFNRRRRLCILLLQSATPRP
jgi:hypothetical protein